MKEIESGRDALCQLTTDIRIDKFTQEMIEMGIKSIDMAVSKIEKLSQTGEGLLNSLEWAMDNREMPEDMQDYIIAWKEFSCD
jgi:hypothetical protein